MDQQTTSKNDSDLLARKLFLIMIVSSIAFAAIVFLFIL